MASDRAIAQAFREAQAMYASAGGSYDTRMIERRAAELDATPPAGAGAAVATVVGEQPVKTGPDGMPTRRAAGKMKMSVVLHRELPPGTKLYATEPSLAAAYLAQVMDEDMKPWRAMREGDAAPTPLPEAVPTLAIGVADLPAEWRLTASRFRSSIPALADALNQCADELERAIGGERG